MKLTRSPRAATAAEKMWSGRGVHGQPVKLMEKPTSNLFINRYRRPNAGHDGHAAGQAQHARSTPANMLFIVSGAFDQLRTGAQSAWKKRPSASSPQYAHRPRRFEYLGQNRDEGLY
jgi:ATP-dependent protease Clp ATPase subunit